jgi:hypothetical protein
MSSADLGQLVGERNVGTGLPEREASQTNCTEPVGTSVRRGWCPSSVAAVLPPAELTLTECGEAENSGALRAPP